MDASDSKKPSIVDIANDDSEALAVGSVEEIGAYSPRTFYRSVLFQMILFGMLVPVLCS